MKQYKHKGTEAIFNKSINGKSYYSDKYEGYYIPSELVENSCDYEEVVQKDYQILKDASGEFTIQGFLSSIEKVKEVILITEDSVELFGGETVYGVTDDFQLCFTSMATKENVLGCRVFAHRSNAEEYIKNYRNYKTVDGKQIVKGQTFYLYDDRWFKCLEGKFGGFKSDKWVGKRYKTKEEVEELILMNKPCLSLNELLDAWGERGNREYYVKSPMFYSFRKFVEKKLGNL